MSLWDFDTLPWRHQPRLLLLVVWLVAATLCVCFTVRAEERPSFPAQNSVVSATAPTLLSELETARE